jgi:DNA-binding MarR family transcriptional regulator
MSRALSLQASERQRGPLLGALLRLAHQTFIREVAAGLAAAGYDDVPPAHYAVTQALWARPEGARVVELAATARITKQSMGELVDHLVARGYVERVADPSDGRAWRVRFTERGWQFAGAARRLVKRVEVGWKKRAGARRIEALRETLRLLVEEDTGPAGV